MCCLRHPEHHERNGTSLAGLEQDLLFFGPPYICGLPLETVSMFYKRFATRLFFAAGQRLPVPQGRLGESIDENRKFGRNKFGRAINTSFPCSNRRFRGFFQMLTNTLTYGQTDPFIEMRGPI